MKYLINIMFLFGVIGCHPYPHPSSFKIMVIDASFENGSTHDLDWVRMEWLGPHFSAGVLPIGISSTDVDLRWPNVPTGKLTFVDEKTRQRYNIELSFKSINEQIQSGQCRVITIRILDYDKAEVVRGSPKGDGKK